MGQARHPPVNSLRHQRGAALLLMMLFLVIAGMAYLLPALSPEEDQTQRIEASGKDMLLAKESLIAFNFAQDGNAKSEDKMSLGRLPLPDMGLRDPNLSHVEGESPKNFDGNSDSTILVGRLPWKTLGTRPLRDDTGECLWYGISAAWKNSRNKDSTDPLRYLPPSYNWDSLGDFELHSTRLQAIHPNPHLSRAVAVILSPGRVLLGQDRSRSTTTGESIKDCGGNYNALNYLDPPALANATASTGSRFNGFTAQVTSTHPDLSGDPTGRNAMSVSSPTLPKNILTQPISTQGVTITNDRVIAITNDDIFGQLLAQTPPLYPYADLGKFPNPGNSSKGYFALDTGNTYRWNDSTSSYVLAHRHSVTTKLNDLLLQLKGCLETANVYGELTSTELTPLGEKKAGKLSPFIGCETATELARWRDNLWYAMQPKSPPPAGKINSTCDGLLVFAGTRNSTQRRSNATEKLAPSNYLEAALNLFTTTGTTATLPTHFGLAGNPTRTDTDIGVCLNHPAGRLVEVGDMTIPRNVSRTGKTLVTPKSATQTIVLGNPNPGSFRGTTAVGCSWNSTPFAFGNGLRVYFNFRYNYYNPSSNSPVGPGFTFALADAETNGDDVCGGSNPQGIRNTGQLMGYAGLMIAPSGRSTITPPKMGFEFDTVGNDAPDRNDTTNSHIAAVYWGELDREKDGNLDNDNDGLVDQVDSDDDNKHAVPALPQSRDEPITQLDPVNDSAFGFPCLRAPDLDPACGGGRVTDRIFHVRIDITRTYDSAKRRAAYYHRLWIKQGAMPMGMDDLNDDFKNIQPNISPDLENRDQSIPPDDTKDDVFIYDSVYSALPPRRPPQTPLSGEAFKRLRYGFTVAQPNARQEVIISNFGVKPRP